MRRWFKPISDFQKDRLLTFLDWSVFLVIAAAFVVGGLYLILT